MDPLEPVAIAYGPRRPWDGIPLESIRIARVATVADAEEGVLANRNVVAYVVEEHTYADADAALLKIHGSARHLPAIVSLRTESWPQITLWRASRGVVVLPPSRLTSELGATLHAIARSARERHDRIDVYGIARGLGPKDTDLLWQRDRGVPRRLLPESQGVKYSTKKQRFERLLDRTELDDIDEVLAEALGDLARRCGDPR